MACRGVGGSTMRPDLAPGRRNGPQNGPPNTLPSSLQDTERDFAAGRERPAEESSGCRHLRCRRRSRRSRRRPSPSRNVVPGRRPALDGPDGRAEVRFALDLDGYRHRSCAGTGARLQSPHAPDRKGGSNVGKLRKPYPPSAWLHPPALPVRRVRREIPCPGQPARFTHDRMTTSMKLAVRMDPPSLIPGTAADIASRLSFLMTRPRLRALNRS